MSEKVLSSACDSCPMRRKINCDEAEVVVTRKHKIPYTNNTGKVIYMEVTPDDPVKYYSFELTDAPNDPESPRIELRPLNTDEFESAAKLAVEVKKLAIEAEGFLPREEGVRGLIETSMHKLGVSHSLGMEERDSLEVSLGRVFKVCVGPQKDESAFLFRRKRCGASVVGRIISGDVIRKWNRENVLLRQGLGVWTTPDYLPKYKHFR